MRLGMWPSVQSCTSRLTRYIDVIRTVIMSDAHR